jgi:hypothetical protein
VGLIPKCITVMNMLQNVPEAAVTKSVTVNEIYSRRSVIFDLL